MNPPEHLEAVESDTIDATFAESSPEALWQKGFTRRRFLAGIGLAGVAALGSQLVTSRMSFSRAGTASPNTLIVLFMRGAADGLRILVPNATSLGLSDLQAARPALVPATGTLLPLSGTGGWALNSKLAPLLPYWNSNELAFVPAVSIENLTRSHFAAQQLIECGGVSTSSSGWLDRTLDALGPGTTFRSVADGGSLPASLAGDEVSLAIQSLANFSLNWAPGGVPANQSALVNLYRQTGGFLGQDGPDAIAASQQAATFATGTPQNAAVYPDGNLSTSLQDFARLLRAEVGLQIGTIDVGGWDTHTSEVSELDPNLGTLAQSLAAFMQDLGPARRSRVTVVVMTEFGRRVAQTASGGTDHGHGSVLWLLGGGLRGSGVYGRWNGVAPSVLDSGDVPMLNNAYDVLGEALQSRLGIGSLSPIFPAHTYAPLGITVAGSLDPVVTPTLNEAPVYTVPH
jgi:uncharacterized protein (DUF1501 family)